MRIFTFIAAAAVSLSATAALADHVGTAEAVTAPAKVSDQKLEKEYELKVGDFVETGVEGQAELHFDDDTKIVLSSKTELEIEEAPDGPAKKNIKLTLIEGSLRVIVGEELGELRINFETRSAKVDHQGTAFDLTVTSLGVTKLLLLEGQVTLCGKDEGDDCETIATPCALLQTDSGEDVEEIGPGNRRVQETLEHFPFQTSDSTLPEEFQFAGLGCTNRAGPIAPSPLDGPPVWIPAATAGAAAAAAIILCVVFCDSGPDTNNKTN